MPDDVDWKLLAPIMGFRPLSEPEEEPVFQLERWTLDPARRTVSSGRDHSAVAQTPTDHRIVRR